MSNTSPIRLRTNLGDAPITRLIRSGEVRSADVTLDITGPDLAFRAFDDMIRRDDVYDAGEIALGTALEIGESEPAFVLLPAVVLARHQHHCLLHNIAVTGPLSPRDLEGRRIGIRAYTQTTGIWIRAVLQHDHGVDLSRIEWVTERDSGVPGRTEPSNVTRLPPGETVADALLRGEIDAAILRDDALVGNRIRHVFDRPFEEANDWAARWGLFPVNHLFAIRKSVVDQEPGLAAAVYRLLHEAKRKAHPSDASQIDFLRFGVEPLRRVVEVFSTFAREQQIVDRVIPVDQVFANLPFS